MLGSRRLLVHLRRCAKLLLNFGGLLSLSWPLEIAGHFPGQQRVLRAPSKLLQRAEQRNLIRLIRELFIDHPSASIAHL